MQHFETLRSVFFFIYLFIFLWEGRYFSELTSALQQVAVIVEALFAVALITGQRVLTVTSLADFLSEQRTLVNVCRPGRNNVLRGTWTFY